MEAGACDTEPRRETYPAAAGRVKSVTEDRPKADDRRLEWALGIVLDHKHHYQLGPAWQHYARLHVHRPHGSSWVGGVSPEHPPRSHRKFPDLKTFAFLGGVSVRTLQDWNARLEHFGYIFTVRHPRGLYIALLKVKEWRAGRMRKLPDPPQARSAVHCLSRSAVECRSLEARFHNDYTLRRRPQDSNLYPKKKETSVAG